MDLTVGSTITLNSGTTMPRLGLGVYQVPFGDSTVYAGSWALAAGFREIDSA